MSSEEEQWLLVSLTLPQIDAAPNPPSNIFTPPSASPPSETSPNVSFQILCLQMVQMVQTHPLQMFHLQMLHMGQMGHLQLDPSIFRPPNGLAAK